MRRLRLSVALYKAGGRRLINGTRVPTDTAYGTLRPGRAPGPRPPWRDGGGQRARDGHGRDIEGTGT